MFQVIGVKSVAPAYGDIVPQDVGEKDGVADEDPLGIESAFTKSGPGILDVSTIEDPLGLDAAFDAAFPCPSLDPPCVRQVQLISFASKFTVKDLHKCFQ